MRNNVDFKRSFDLNDVRRSLKSVEVDFMSLNVDRMKTDSSPRPQRTLNQSSATQSTTSGNSLGSKKILDNIFVGIDRDAELIRDKLVDDGKKLDVVSIVGMGGIGKITVATKVFNDGYVKHHFRIRVWVTVSQTYDKRAVLIQILESIRDQLDLEKASDSRLRELVHKHLMGRRYLIVIDDIWHIETWDNLKLFFPHGDNGSRILITSRITEVAKHANLDGMILPLGCLNKEKGWELLCQKVFRGNKYPEWSLKPGMRIVESCHRLPLAVVVIAGVLAKEAWNEKFWMEIAYSASLYIVGDQNGCLEILGLSYNNLPLHLRECFLYLGGFPEDYMFKVRDLIWLWVAEGFIQQTENKSLEDIAEGYLMDLIDRNLVIVAHRSKSNEGVTACKVHDLVKELCLKKAKEERFILQTERLVLFFHRYNVITPPYKPVRVFINKDIYDPHIAHPPPQNLRSILVLDLQKCRLTTFPKGMELLVNLRYLAIWKESAGFPSLICNLWNLQTLIYVTPHIRTVLPSNISDLVYLRHLLTYQPSKGDTVKRAFILCSIEKPMNLQTISKVMLGYGVDNFQKCFPHVKELRCSTFPGKEYDFKSLACLEKLTLIDYRRIRKSSCGVNRVTFPATLRILKLVECRLPWSDMSILQSLTNLEVLKLKLNAFEGSYWNTNEQEFPQLKFLRLEMLDIKLWEAYSPSFPCLKRLEIFHCYHLKETPLGIGDISTLELIKIKGGSHSLGESVRRIQEDQHDFGNYDLKIDVIDDPQYLIFASRTLSDSTLTPETLSE
ncbi:putative P-loop containing nucleoside triphosphate hydrolase, leucine-rich repeat domain superfamily [Helianthus annuus]|nr:putative P-loop containing nucleoside triphosphate hydrolase, leucine-rich repeat domain superfamily [Helianthus annuus]KAJ0684932.1 putative P-loop containing nucleoside triphosphate hydrolase, leucine-rich repeat domain superfamily [Helianthus annuus]KAJ0688858.1 putative P-loop containing nucleoside triphosphate hydrolase, leucine-rich repeat domain superfamily [Helianthus annuus]